MAETAAAENRVVDGDQADYCDADINEANDAVHSAQENTADVDSEPAANHSTSSHQPTVLTEPTDSTETNSGGLQEAPVECTVSLSQITAAGQ